MLAKETLSNSNSYTFADDLSYFMCTYIEACNENRKTETTDHEKIGVVVRVQSVYRPTYT